MQTKLQELTEKIYQEGVIKAKEETDKMTAAAQKQADEIVASAKKQAEEIVKDAEKQASELKSNSINELQLSARQLISDARQKLVSLIENKVVQPEVKESFKDPKFTQELVQTLIKNWNPKDDKPIEIKTLLPFEKQKEFEAFFTAKTLEMLGKGTEISFSDKIKGGFKIGPKDGGFLISFSDDDFDNLFRGYLRPRMIELLFGKQ